MLKISHLLCISVFICTTVAYLIFFILGRRWRRKFEAEGVGYWKAPKEERVKELMEGVWQPRLISGLYFLAYFIEGYVRTVIMVWASLFLLQVLEVNTLDVALFMGLIYVAWSWKMFIGMVSDACPIRWRGRHYRRTPWFLLSGLMSVAASIPFLLYDPRNMPLWTGLFPSLTAIMSADCILDLAADSYVMDVVPPEWHARILGGVAFSARSIGGAAACILPPLFLAIGGYRLVFLTAGLVGALVFPCILLKEPELEHERIFSKKTIAFTFTERTIPLMLVVQLGIALSPRAFASPIGGMFTLIAGEVVGLSTDAVAKFSLAGVLAGVPGALLGGWAADKWGHKRTYMVSIILLSTLGMMWSTLRLGMAVWFTVLAVATNFFLQFRTGSTMGLMADLTPLGLTSTVSQMYASFVWIGGILASAIVGSLIKTSLPVCVIVVSLIPIMQLIALQFVRPYEAGKATKI